MALQRVKLADPQYVGSAAGSLYANPAGTKTLVAGITLHNTNTSNEAVKVYVVPDSAGAAGAAGVDNRVYAVTLAPDETYTIVFPLGVMLTDENDSIQAQTTTASKVTAIVHGDQIN